MIKNISANIIGKIFSSLTVFFFIPLYIIYLGFESYSVISFTLVIYGLMIILDGGITSTLSRELARNDIGINNKIQTFKTLETTYFVIVLLCISTLFYFSDLIAINFVKSIKFDDVQITFFVKIVSFGIGFEMLIGLYLGGLIGLEKQIKANVFRVSWGLVRNGLIIILLIYKPTLEFFFIWQTMTSFVFAILLKFELNKLLTGFYFKDLGLKIEKSVLNKIKNFAFGMFFISIVAGLNSQLDKLFISNQLSIENLGYYTLSVSLSMVLYFVINPVSVATLPRFTSLFSNGKKDEAIQLFLKLNLIISIIIFVLLCHMIFYSENLMWIWTGDKILANNAHKFLPVIATAYSMIALQILPFNIAIANAYTKLNNILGISSLIIIIPAYWITIKSFGAIGAAYTFCIAQMIITIIYIYFIRQKFLRTLSLKLLYLEHLIYPLLASLTISYILSHIVLSIDFYSRIIALIAIGVSLTLTFFFTVLFFPKLNLMLIIRSYIFKNKVFKK